MKIEKTAHSTTIGCRMGEVTVCNELGGRFVTKQLQITNEHGDNTYINLLENELDALISALQFAKTHYQN